MLKAIIIARRLAAGLIVIISLLTFASDVSAVEVIQNGSFEGFDQGRPLIQGWDDGAGLGNDIGLGQFDYPVVIDGQFESGTLIELPPGATDPSFTGVVQPVGAGAWFGTRWGWGNGSGFQGSATQNIDVANHAGKPFEFSAWLASRPISNDLDYATVTLEFFDEPRASGAGLGTIIFDGNDQTSDYIIGSLNLAGVADPTIAATQDNWTLYYAFGTIPSEAMSAAVVIRGEVAGGAAGGDNGYVDLVSLQVVPEPSSAALACAFGALGAAWCVRRTICWS